MKVNVASEGPWLQDSQGWEGERKGWQKTQRKEAHCQGYESIQNYCDRFCNVSLPKDGRRFLKAQRGNLASTSSVEIEVSNSASRNLGKKPPKRQLIT
jgi:hypothetical protein